MTGLFTNKKRTSSIALVAATAIAFTSIAACIIAAAPREDEDEMLETVSATRNEPQRITAPVQTDAVTTLADPVVTAPPVTEATVITNYTDNLVADAPEIVTEPETSAPETKAPVIIETTIVIPETTAPETEDELISKSHSVIDDSGFYYVVPEMKIGFLADELGVDYTICKPKYKVTEEEITLAATIIQLEVMGAGSSLYRFEDYQEKYWEMCAVAQCIRNRTESNRFPNTAKGVMLQSTKTARGKVLYQFSPADKLSLFTPTEEAVVAAREVLIDGVSVLPSNYYYFCATRIEASFEKNNNYMLVKKANGSYDKVVGHLTTFYAGHK